MTTFLKNSLPLFISTIIWTSSCVNRVDDGAKSHNDTTSSKIELQDSLPLNANGLHIEDGRIGTFHTGNKFEQNTHGYKYERKTRIEMAEGGSDTLNYVIVSNTQGDLFEVYLDSQDHIAKIKIISDRCKTKKGVSVSSTLEKLVKAYDIDSIYYTYVSQRFFVTPKELPSLQFVLDNNSYIGSDVGLMDSDLVQIPINHFEESSKITEIILL